MNKKYTVQVEIAQQKQDFDRRVKEMEGENDNLKKNAARAIESLQTTLDSEMRGIIDRNKISIDRNEINHYEISSGRVEALRQKKAVEVNLVEIKNLQDECVKENENLKRVAQEGAVNLARAQAEIKAADKTSEDLREQVAMTERRANLIQVSFSQSFFLISQMTKKLKLSVSMKKINHQKTRVNFIS